jgi:hypothetical protein
LKEKKKCECGQGHARESEYCRKCDPVLKERARMLAEEKYVNEQANYILAEKEACALYWKRYNEAEKERQYLNNLKFEAQKLQNDVAFLLDMEKTAKRLDEVYEVAKAAGDAAMMMEANKSMHYARRNMEKTLRGRCFAQKRTGPNYDD